MNPRPPLPPFTLETARQKVQAAEDAWNSRDPERVSLAYTEDTEWRNRAEFVHGRAQVVEFLRRKWNRELDYRLKKELWAFLDNRIAVRFEYEWHDDSGQWYRSYGNENWEFDALPASTICPSKRRTVSSGGNGNRRCQTHERNAPILPVAYYSPTTGRRMRLRYSMPVWSPCK